MNSECQSSSPATRIHYSKVVNDCLRYVIADVSGGETIEFWTQDAGEVRWFRFDPAPEERAAALALWRAGGAGGPGWPLLLP